ncbi:MAG: TIGR02302 family protein, partial [Pseudorhodoplanes sp.]
MTERPSQTSEKTGLSVKRQIDALLARGIARARYGILWERVWPPLAALATVCGLFLVFSWLGLWLWLPPLWRAVGVVIFGLMALAALSPFVVVRIPNAVEGLRRLDQRSGLEHRPAIALTDKLAANEGDAMTQALWRAHVDRALAAARKLKAGWPKPGLSARDPIALRALVLVLLVATFFAAGGDRYRRVATAFNWQGAVAPSNYRIDAWVTPPQYTARPPVILPGLRPGEAVRAQAPIAVPSGSILLIRASGANGLEVALRGGIKVDDKPDNSPTTATAAAGTEERRYVIQDQSEVTLRGIGDPVVWSFQAIPDRAPTIALTKDPEPQQRGSLMLNYKIEDDYGVTEARANFELKPQQPSSGKAARPLYGAPDMPLVLPQARARNGVSQTLRDLSDHPWAGAEVTLTLSATDEGANEGRSQPFDMRLPERLFTKPMARALIEQRRNLALDAETKPQILTALDALTIAPEV